MLYICVFLILVAVPETAAFKASLHHQQLMMRRMRHQRSLLNENSRIPTTYVLFLPRDDILPSIDNFDIDDSTSSTALGVSFTNLPDEQNDDFVGSSSEKDATKSMSVDIETAKAASPLVQYMTLGVSLLSVSAFILVNKFVGPWPVPMFEALPDKYWLLIHYVSGTMFAGTIVVSAILENMVTSAKSQENFKDQLLQFWFERVPQMDAQLVLPSIVLLLVSGTANSFYRYGSLMEAPKHIMLVFVHLVAFLIWWACTDITTQAKVLEWYHRDDNDDADTSLKQILNWRKISNVGSCMFLLALFAIMTLKPGMI